MLKKIFILICSYFLFYERSFAWLFNIFTDNYNNYQWWKNSAPINCKWLPWCWSSTSNQAIFTFTSKLISELIKYVAVFAVLALIISWIKYILSSWEEEKAKKAKTWIIWSLVWVFISISAWSIINIINNFSIN